MTVILESVREPVKPQMSLPGASSVEFTRIKREIHHQLVGAMDLTAIGKMPEEELRVEIRRAAETLCARRHDLLSIQERERLITELIQETFGLGPLESLMKDPEISDILVNGPKVVYVERRGKLESVPIEFEDEDHLLQVIQRIVSRVGRRVDEMVPMVDARLPDGSRVNAIIRPLALDGPLLSIRRFGARPLLGGDFLAKESLTPEMLDFLAACVTARISMLISGGTGAGKTTLLNLLSSYIPTEERIATIEDSAELRLQQRHIVRMETRPANIEGKGQVTQRDLVRNALRMRPDRIVIGECRGAEALDMLQAMNTGHEGSLTTVHANDTRDAISRLEVMVGMAGLEMPIWVVRRQIASAIHVVVQMSRLAGGSRKIVKISEITGLEGEIITMHDLFLYKQTGVDEEHRAQGYFCATGIRPQCLQRLEIMGVHLPPETFESKILNPSRRAMAG